MTVRIRQIAVDASNWCCENAKGTPVAWEWEEKFAELMIEEFLDIAENELHSQAYAQILAKVQKRFYENTNAKISMP